MNDSTPQQSQLQFTFEEWRDVVGYEGHYQVSNLGRVRGLERTVKHSRPGETKRWRGGIKTQTISSKGYCSVTFQVDNIRKCVEVHRLVGEAFIGPLPDGYHTHHINENRSDNQLSNLEYRPVFLHQHFHHRGEKAHKAVLTREQVKEIQRLLAEGIYQRVIAKQYGVSRSTIGEINRGASWAWLDN